MFKFAKYLCIIVILAASFVFQPNAALAGGGFTASCTNIRLLNNANSMQADCSNNAQQVVRATVYLNGSITNNNGTLAWQKNGGFARSSNNCSLGFNRRKKAVLSCNTTKADGSVTTSGIVLDSEIANYNGVLTVLDGF